MDSVRQEDLTPGSVFRTANGLITIVATKGALVRYASADGRTITGRIEHLLTKITERSSEAGPIPLPVERPAFIFPSSGAYGAARMYGQLSEDEILFVVEQWDADNGFPPPSERLAEQKNQAKREREHKFWHIGCAIAIFLLAIWASDMNREISSRADDSKVLEHLRDEAKNDPKLSAALDEADKWDQEQIDAANDH